MKFGLEQKTIDQIYSIFAKYNQIDQVIIYGSRAKGNYKKGSDIDLVIKGRDLDLSILQDIELEIDDLLLPYTFDISIFEHLKDPDLIDHIQRVGQVFYP